MKSYGEREQWLRRQREGRFSRTVETGTTRSAVRKEQALPIAGEVAPNVISRGRPLRSRKAMTLTALQPWAGYGMARSTWYRRRREGTLPRVKEGAGGWQASAELIAKVKGDVS